MKHLFAIILFVLAGTVHASSLTAETVRDAGFDTLSGQEKAEIIKNIADRKAANTQASVVAKVAEQTTPQKVNEWLDIGTRIGSGMAGAAKEMGVAVNEFAESPVGMWTIALITWKFMGGVIMHAFGAIMIWLIGFSFIWWINRRRTGLTMQYDPNKTDIFGRSRLISVEKQKVDDDTYASVIICSFIVLIGGMLVLFTY